MVTLTLTAEAFTAAGYGAAGDISLQFSPFALGTDGAALVTTDPWTVNIPAGGSVTTKLPDNMAVKVASTATGFGVRFFAGWTTDLTTAQFLALQVDPTTLAALPLTPAVQALIAQQIAGSTVASFNGSTGPVTFGDPDVAALVTSGGATETALSAAFAPGGSAGNVDMGTAFALSLVLATALGA